MAVNHALEIKQLCKEYRVYPEKTRGQHFLINDTYVKKMVDAAGITKDDLVVEVGAGWGILTEELVARARKVIAIEIEEKMVGYLRQSLKPDGIASSLPGVAPRNDIEIWHGDVRRFWDKMPQEPYHVIANIPYNITGLIIRSFLEKTPRAPEQMVLMVQKEVAERITAAPGDMTMLALSVQYYGKPKKLFTVPKGAFWPQPEVDSAVIRIANIARPDEKETKILFALAHRAFATKRKQMVSSLASTALGKTKEDVAAALVACGLKPTARPQELGIADWRRLIAHC
ncbi:MAG: 16S rRNA (adenine(1518)-N(6)/adenine(1519)-N(6))-dimethyltransferase RsmA [Patescibacteria group bacterium]